MSRKKRFGFLQVNFITDNFRMFSNVFLVVEEIRQFKIATTRTLKEATNIYSIKTSPKYYRC